MPKMIALAIALSFAQTGSVLGAPKDVPRSHWAYEAVDELFKAGILHGYPPGAPPLTLRANLPRNMHFIAQTMNAAMRLGHIIIRSDDDYLPGKEGAYERAVQAYAVTKKIASLFSASGGVNDEEAVLQLMPALVDVISMLATELKALGVNPDAMVHELASHTVLFVGSNR